MAERWPGAKITGFDDDENMLAKAATAPSTISWERGDITTFQPPEPPDLIYSNAALNWVPDHQNLIPRLFGFLAPGGVLALQMPRNYADPSHTGITDAALEGPWDAELAHLIGPAPVHEPSFYYEVLSPLAARLDIWETQYLHVLEGEDPVVKWFSTSALRPFLEALEEPMRGRYLADYTARMREAYPPQGDGRTLFTMRRTFVLAVART